MKKSLAVNKLNEELFVFNIFRNCNPIQKNKNYNQFDWDWGATLKTWF